MDRRSFIHSGLIAAGGMLAASQTSPLLATGTAGASRFRVTTTVELPASAGPAQVWLPLFAETATQHVRSMNWTAPSRVAAIGEGKGGYALVAGLAGPVRTLELVEEVETADRVEDRSSLSAAERAYWTRPGASPADQAVIAAKAAEITAGVRGDEAKARAIYEWVVTNTWRDEATIDCGPGDSAKMLRTGAMGGKCADINSLFVCFCRAAGIPAREQFGIRLAPSALAKAMGSSGTITGAQHCRAEAWLEGRGWVPVDAADVRKVMLDEKLELADARVGELSDRLFGYAEGNWGLYNRERGLALGGVGDPTPYDFLMYPTAVGPDGGLPRGVLGYRIEVADLTA